MSSFASVQLNDVNSEALTSFLHQLIVLMKIDPNLRQACTRPHFLSDTRPKKTGITKMPLIKMMILLIVSLYHLSNL